MMRVAIYARVSTDDRGQCPENQLMALREWCAQSGHEVVDEYVEHESGRKGTERRAQFARLFEDGQQSQVRHRSVLGLDRFSREGMVQTIMHLQRLDSYGVKFHSYTEAHLNTDNELVRNVLLALLSSLAKVGPQKISERTKAGLERARRRGARIGRPQLEEGLRSEITQRLADGATPFAVARALGIDRKTVLKYAGHLPYHPQHQPKAELVPGD
jgi:DNA invertase Pin-like site-specific DNA recombinase